jgi:flagella basal body P-ring formation protein FlgA
MWYTSKMGTDSAQLPRLPVAPCAKVFISHSSKDEPVVRWLAAQVKAAGHQAWVAEWELQPGEQLSAKVLTALAECDAYILLLTEDGEPAWV